MARGRREVPPCCKRYGSPLYCANWVPVDRITSSLSKRQKEEEEEKKGDGAPEARQVGPTNDDWMVVLGGGGGEGRSGVRNVLLLVRFDPASRSLSDQPVFRLETEGDLPYRMAVHPGGEGVMLSFPKNCRWFEWNFTEGEEGNNLALKPSEQSLVQLEEVGLQLALAFSPDGSLLATGGEVHYLIEKKSPSDGLSICCAAVDLLSKIAKDILVSGLLANDGHLRVFKWPSMESVVDQSEAHPSVKDLDFSSDGKLLASLGSGGPCRIWDMTSNKAVASLPRENGENFGYCRFSQRSDHSQIVYVTAMQGQYGKIMSWEPLPGKRVGSKHIVRDPICAFNVSPDGKLLAVGTIEGDIVVLNSNLQALMRVKKAHLGIVTALVFKDSRAMVSASFDASTRVTLIEKKKSGFGIWVFLVILLAILVYLLKLRAVI